MALGRISRRSRAVGPTARLGGLAVAVLLVTALAPRSGRAAGCDELLRGAERVTGVYVPSGEPYARSFVFALLLTCNGAKEVVTVQRATGHLPVCAPGQPVEVVGKPIWNKALVDGHYEINNPSSVTCRPVARAGPGEPKAPGALPPPRVEPLAPAAPPRAQTKPLGASVWTGRYQDSRGAGSVTFTLVRGESMVSGTWALRTGGGGPVTGLLEAGGGRMRLRMENIAPECPGTFEGIAQITETSVVGSYEGRDCQGRVTGGTLELRLQ